ncbi:MAG: polyprenol monophosphomannose synthase [Thermodesulfobacteriota bacterium]|nr:polyprenol monophosphomannose synthase [Thermodesulfobacteriota bacterium]
MAGGAGFRKGFSMNGDGYGNLLIFIPTYNEAGNIGEMIARLGALDRHADILFIDDASPDGTGPILDKLAAGDPAIRVIHRPCKKGIGSAHLEAIAFAYKKGYSLLVTMDADFTHPPEAVPALLLAAREADVVVGSRFVEAGGFEGWSRWREGLSRFGHWATQRLLNLPHDATGAFRVYRLNHMDPCLFYPIRASGYAFFFESLFVLAKKGVKIVDVPVVVQPRRYGTSKMGRRHLAESLWTLARLRITTRL